MTDDDKALVKRLRWWGEDGVSGSRDDIVSAADRIEALTAENERLREHLASQAEELLKYRAKYMVGTSRPWDK